MQKMQDDLNWCALFLWLGVGGRSCSNFMASSVILIAWQSSYTSCWAVPIGSLSNETNLLPTLRQGAQA